jgi:hypothetical protein
MRLRHRQIKGPPAFYHQHAYLELGRLERRVPPGGPGASDDKSKCCDAPPCLKRTARQDVNVGTCRIGSGPFVLGSYKARRVPMQKIIVGAMVSLDGVMQSPGAFQ